MARQNAAGSLTWTGFLVLLTVLILIWGLPNYAGAWSLKEAARPYAGQTIKVLDEVTPLQETMKKIVPEFVKESGINVDFVIYNHFEVIDKGQSDMLAGAGTYDSVMCHSGQLGLLLQAEVLRPIDEFLNDPKLRDPNLDLDDLIEPAWTTLAKFKGKTYGFLNWNYNEVYWARADLLNHPDEKKAFKERYGYELKPAETMQQMRDIAEFFTRKKGEKLAGETLQSDFYGIALEGLKGGYTFFDVWANYMENWGGGIFDAQGRPNIDSPENIAAVKFWASLWKFSPPGQAEFSLIDIPTVMGNGIAAQTIAFSDFVLGIDNPGRSKYSGKFTYRGIPRNANYSGPTSALTEPSLLTISILSGKPEATYLFLQWAVAKSTQARLFEVGGAGVPVRESTWDWPALTGSRHAALYKAMRTSLKVGKARPKAPNLYEIMNVMGGIFQQIGTGKKSVEEGLKEGQLRVLEICKECVLK